MLLKWTYYSTDCYYKFYVKPFPEAYLVRLEHLLPLHYLEWSDSKRFTRQIGLRHVNLSQTALIKGCEMLPSRFTF